MSDSALVDDVAPDPVTLRAALRAQLAKRRSEEGRHAALSEALDRVREEQRPIRSRLYEAEEVLKSALRDAKLTTAYQYLNHDQTSDPVTTAKTTVAAIRGELDRLESIETALSDEASRVATNLRQLNVQTWDAASAVVVQSPEYIALTQAHREAWVNLRTIRFALKTVNDSLHGRVPQHCIDEPVRGEPLLNTAVGYTTNYELSSSWQQAVLQLETDANAPLPGAAPVTPLARPAPLRSVPLTRALAAAPGAGNSEERQ